MLEVKAQADENSIKNGIRRIDTGKLRESKVRQDFRLELKNRFQVLQSSEDGNEAGRS
jgi:hypothetical protein